MTRIKSYIHNKLLVADLRLGDEIKKRGWRKTFNLVKKGLVSRYITGLPHTIMIEPTWLCNLSCTMCFQENIDFGRKTHFLDLEAYKKTIDDIKDFCHTVRLFFTGEPMLHKDIDKMIRYAVDNNIYTVMFTNGTKLDEENREKLLNSRLDKLVVSFDGATKATFEKIRVGADFAEVKDGIQELARNKKKKGLLTPYIEMSLVGMAENWHEIDDFRKLAYSLGVDKVSVRSLNFWSQVEDPSFKERVRKFFIKESNSRYERSSSGELFPRQRYSICPHYQRSVITSDGSVTICCNDLMAKYKFGNALTENFKDIWRRREFSSFRKRLAKHRKLDICKNCGVVG